MKCYDSSGIDLLVSIKIKYTQWCIDKHIHKCIGQIHSTLPLIK